MRFDLSSAAVLALAVASALATAWWMDQAGLRGSAQAATPVSTPATGHAAQVVRAADGHYWAEADIDGRAVRVMVDTGASVVALTPADAARLGLKLTAADFSGTVLTASGPVRAAPVRLDAGAGGGGRGTAGAGGGGVPGRRDSLLGMSYLGRLSAFTATPAGLTLRP